MKTTHKRRSTRVSFLTALAALIACVIAVNLCVSSQPVRAEIYYFADINRSDKNDVAQVKTYAEAVQDKDFRNHTLEQNITRLY